MLLVVLVVVALALDGRTDLAVVEGAAIDSACVIGDASFSSFAGLDGCSCDFFGLRPLFQLLLPVATVSTSSSGSGLCLPSSLP